MNVSRETILIGDKLSLLIDSAEPVSRETYLQQHLKFIVPRETFC